MSAEPATAPNPGALDLVEPAWRPSTKAPAVWTVAALTLWGPLTLAAALAWVFGWWPTPVHATLFGVVGAWSVFRVGVVPQWRYRVHRWQYDDTAVTTRTGWFVQTREIAPISRIQTVDTQRGPLNRFFGLSDVNVTTASTSGTVHIHALDQSVADEAVERLTRLAAQTQQDAT